MFVHALLAALAVWICVMTDYVGALVQATRPIIAGPLVGLALGDFTTGCIIGAQLEIIFLGIVAVGSSTSADPTTSTGIAVAMAVLFDVPIEQAVALGIPIGYVGLLLINAEYFTGTLFAQFTDKLIEKDKQTAYSWWIFVFTGVMCLYRPVVVFLAIMLGGNAVSAFMDSLPAFVMNGISAAGAMLPAVGLGMLISMLWSGKMFVYFLLGFAMVVYLQVPILFAAIIAVFLAGVDIIRSMDLKKIERKQGAGIIAETHQPNDEEDFFE